MSYKHLQEDAEQKNKSVKAIVVCILAGVLLLVGIISLFLPADGWKYNVDKPKTTARKAGELRIHYLDVGQGDATIIELPDGRVMLIDGGDGTSTTKKNILRYLNALEIEVIDYLVVTHTDSDHCGSLEEVLTYKTVLNAYLPHADTAKNVEYAEAYAAILEEKCKLNFSSRSVDLSVKEGETPYTLSFLYPYSASALGEVEEESNDTSAVIWLDYNGASAIFLGDSTMNVENVLMRDHRLGLLPKVDLKSTEILKVAHHGGKESTFKEFLSYLGVKTAILSYGEGNIYKHPSSAVMDRLAVANADVYQTALHGNIVVTIEESGEYSVECVEN